ncbi:MAG: RNA polymerase sigma factor [Vicinamibacteria bacterium]
MAGRGDLESLVGLARSGSSAAWGRVYENLAPSVFRICRRVLASREDAEDATSEVFLKARVRLGTYDPSRPFVPWLYRVAANHCWDEIRKRKSRAELEDGEGELSTLEDESPSPQEAVLAFESRESMRRLLRELDDRSRTAVVLRYFAEMSYEEIGQVLGISANFVGVLLLRARRTLRQRLESK